MNEAVSGSGAEVPSERERVTVLSVAFPYAAVGPKAVGGAEVICSQMEAALVEAGYRSVVVAHAVSAPVGRLYGTAVPPGTITDALRAEVEVAHQRNIDRALRENEVSLVHMHGLDFDRYRIPEHVPVLVTLHLPPGWYPETIWDLPANYHLVCVSETQRRACPAAAQGRLQVIGNGVALPDASSLRSQGRYALMLARICEEKNLHAGLEAARLAQMPALLAGEVFPYEAHQRYFTEQIEPRLTAEGSQHEARHGGAAQESSARFVGAVADEEKARLLSRAACLLLPSLAPETSSLVAMEALAAGVPVIAMRVGAVPEIVQHGVTGFLVDPDENAVQAMAEAIGRLGEIDRPACRQSAAERFGLDRMASGYLHLYDRLVAAREERALQLQEVAEPGALEASELQVDTLTTDAALEGVVPEWEALWREDRGTTPFQHPAWLMPWWRQFGPDGRLQTLTLRRGSSGELVGLLPLYVYQRDAAAERKMLLLGAGTTDYLDGVWRAVGDVAAHGLQDVLQGRDWDVLSLDQVRRASPLREAAECAGLTMGEGEPCAVLDCGVDLPAKIRANVSRYGRRAEARGPVLCRVARSAAEALADFDLLLAFSSTRWEQRGEAGVLSDARVQAHHRGSLPLLLKAGLLRMFRLSVGDEPAGVLYGLVDGEQVRRRRLYLYLIGFAAGFAEISPGTLLLHAAWGHARQEGLSAVDLLRGGEAYKQLWGALGEPTVRISWRRDRGAGSS